MPLWGSTGCWVACPAHSWFFSFLVFSIILILTEGRTSCDCMDRRFSKMCFSNLPFSNTISCRIPKSKGKESKLPAEKTLEIFLSPPFLHLLSAAASDASAQTGHLSSFLWNEWPGEAWSSGLDRILHLTWHQVGQPRESTQNIPQMSLCCNWARGLSLRQLTEADWMKGNLSALQWVCGLSGLCLNVGSENSESKILYCEHN